MEQSFATSHGLRRTVLVLTALVTMFAGLVTTIEPATAAAYRTTANLNLRSGPGTSHAVVRVIPSGATVEVTGEAQSGFLPVTYSGSSGFASADYLTSGSGSGSGTSSGPTGTRYVVDGRLNLRSGPSTSYGVMLVLQDGSAVQLTGEVSGSYSKVTYNGSTGWVATQYLSASSGSGNPGSGSNDGSGSGSVAIGDVVTGSATTTVRLNLRRGPATSYGTILTMASGASVEVMGTSQSGFLPVRYNGTKGWASAQYLGSGSTTPPPSSGSGTVIDTKETTANVNLRTGPGISYGVVVVVPAGTEVGITGSAQNGYSPVKWGSRTGYISSSYLGEPGAAPPPPSGNSSEQEIINIIYAAADRWGQPRADMLRVARCESGLNPNAVNRSSGASGLFQFMPGTWAGTPNGRRGESVFNAYAAADATGWMWANGMRHHWSCQ